MTGLFSLDVKNVKKDFKKIQALRGVSMNFENGVMHGIIGPEGAGKTTLLRLILGLMKPLEGSIEFTVDGQRVQMEDVRADIAYMPQSQSLYPDLSIERTSLELLSKNSYGFPESYS